MNTETQKSREKNNQGFYFLVIIAMTVIGFFIGKMDFQSSEPEIKEVQISREIPVITLTKREGDQIFAKIDGDAKIVWAENFLLTTDGTIFFSQIPTADDLKLADFKYLGNSKTKKFYPARSYPARGTEVKYRRFFSTKEEALKAGFKASKLVK